MICPNCGKEMVEKDFGGVIVDVCENGCHGLWFDNFEIEKLDEHSEGDGEELSKVLEKPMTDNPKNRKMECPKCKIKMAEHRYRMGKIYIDECYSCGGIFLDAGELQEIRNQFKSDKEIKNKVANLFEANDEYNDTMGKFLKQRGARSLSLTEKFLRVIGFLG